MDAQEIIDNCLTGPLVIDSAYASDLITRVLRDSEEDLEDE